MAVIVNFDTTTLEGLVTALSAAETTLDARVTTLLAAQTAENAAEAGLTSGGSSVAHAIEVLNAPTSEYAIAQRIERGIAAQAAAIASPAGTLAAASAAVTAAQAALVIAQTAKNAALLALTNYIASIA
jgi:hypothetical protein